MIRKFFFIILLFLFSSVAVFSIDVKNAQPYEKIEFAKWSLDLRRADTIFFGSLPITVPVTFLIFDAFKSEWEFWPKFGIACGASAIITLTDFILGKIPSKT